MNVLRLFALVLCLAPLCYLGAAAQAAQPVGQAQAAQGKLVPKAAHTPAQKQPVKSRSPPGQACAQSGEQGGGQAVACGQY